MSTDQLTEAKKAYGEAKAQADKAHDEAVAPGPQGPTVIPFRPPRQTEPRFNRPDICRRGGCLEPVTDHLIRLCAGHLAKYTPEAERAGMRQAALLRRRPSV
jgi:hypothetical protein